METGKAKDGLKPIGGIVQEQAAVGSPIGDLVRSLAAAHLDRTC